MTRFNPLRCESETTRRLSIAVLGASLLGWVTWVGVASGGFSNIKPAGWLLFLGLPVAVYVLLLFVMPVLRKTTRELRLLLSACVMWVFCVGAWGYIAQWEAELSSERYLALFILPPAGACLAFLLWKWSKLSK